MLKEAKPMLNDLAVTALLHGFLMMCLHFNTDSITCFASKCCEAEARRAYEAFQPWSSTKDVRSAISHAAQVIRIARKVPPYQLRGCDSFILYHAIMVLGAYSMMHRDAARDYNGDNTSRKSHGFGGSKRGAMRLDRAFRNRLDHFVSF